MDESFSIGKSTLTLEKPEEILDNKPISIFSIAKANNLKEVYLVENNFSGFIESYKNSKDNNIQLKFGLKLVICNNIEDKSKESENTESKVIIWMKNSAGYSDLIKIYSKAACDGFYYYPRLDWALLQSMFTDNLFLSIPSYSSFLHNNLLKRMECVPDFGKIKPNIMVSNMSLPFDFLIKEAHTAYAKSNNLNIIEIHPIYFYGRKQLDSYLCFKAIHNRGQFSNIKVDHHSSSEFCWEEYLKK